jgi:hypothetical protein
MHKGKRYTEKDDQYIVSCIKKYGVKKGIEVASQVLGRSESSIRMRYYNDILYPGKRMDALKKLVNKIPETIISVLIGNVYQNPMNLRECFEKTAEETGYTREKIQALWYVKVKHERKVFMFDNPNAEWNVKNKMR